MNPRVDVKCDVCGIDFQVAECTYNQKRRTKQIIRCPECMRKYRSEKKRKEMAKMDPEKKRLMYEKAANSSKEYWKTVDDEDKKRRMQAINEGAAKWRENETEEERQRISKLHSEANKRRFASMTNYDRLMLSRKGKEIWENKTEEQKQAYSQKSKEMWENKSAEDIERFRKMISNAKREFWQNIPENKKQELGKKIGDTLREYYANISVEKMLEKSQKHRDYWESISDEEKEAMRKKKISVGQNGLHRKFVKLWKLSSMSGTYELRSEDLMESGDFKHRWDYAIYDKEGNLQMVIDLDGASFHADVKDYDAVYSKLEYDEMRYLTIPPLVKALIIPEVCFENAFNFVEKYIGMNYVEYANDKLRHYRAMPFPYPHHSDSRLMISYTKLVTHDQSKIKSYNVIGNTRLGDMIIYEFHHSIWDDNKKGELAPTKVWNSDKLEELVYNNVIYQTWHNPNKVLQGFNATKVDVFSAGKAKMLIDKYLSAYDVIFDPFSGYSGRMLGTVALGKRYIGQDLSERHVNESNNMIRFIKDYTPINATVVRADVLSSSGEYECLFTYPPDGTEEYEEVPFDDRSADDWIDICLNRFKCNRYMFIVADTKKYSSNIVDVITSGSVFGNPKEYVVLI